MKGGLINLVALAVLVAVLWFGGQYLEVAPSTRILAIVGVLVLWLVLYMVQRLRAIRTAWLIEQRLREQAADQIASSRPAEREHLEDLERRLKEAIHALKASKLGKAALAELPWYMFIGPPGSGKSTALQESGLEFPKVGQGLNGIQGVGGTRNCEWWFTSEGILLDTAGRYTTVVEDRDEWLAFLKMIKTARNKTPINGALVAISVSDILPADDEAMERHAKAVRERLDELSQHLEEVFPVYLVFTKCDLLAGFVDFYESLSRREREQVWGHTFPYSELSSEQYRGTFRQQCEGILERLGARRGRLLAGDLPPDKIGRVYSFPIQFAAAQEKLGRFLELAFRPNPLRETPILRGFYFTSGTQEGRPIDQVMGALRDAFGVKAAAPEGAEVKADKKSYFITDLFRKVIFPDRKLARSLASAERRSRQVQVAALALCGLASTVMSVALVWSFFSNRGLIARVAVGLESVHAAEQAKGTKALDALRALDTLRPGVEELYQHESSWTGPPLGMTWGLYQGDKLNSRARQLYFTALHKHLLGPAVKCLEEELGWAVEAQADVPKLKKLYGYNHDQDFYDGLYQQLRVYLMLGKNRLEPHAEDVRAQLLLRNRWLRGVGVKADDKPGGELLGLATAQLDFLLTQFERSNEWGPELDDALINKVRKKLEANYWVSQSYTQIRDTRADQAGKETLETLFPGGASDIFQPAEPVSKVFSKKEWEDYFSRAIGEKSSYLAAQYAEMKTPKDQATIEEELKNYYLLEARQRWGRLLDDLRLQPFGGVDGASKRLALLASPKSPLGALFNDVYLRQFVLSAEAEAAKLTQRPPPTRPEPGVQIKPWQEQVMDSCARMAKAFQDLAKTPAGERFWARALQDGGLRALDPVQTALSEEASRLLDYILPQVPAPEEPLAKRVFQDIIDRTRDALTDEASAEANTWWKREVYQVWRDKCETRYPFAPKASDEAPVQEVVALLNPRTGTWWQGEKALERLAAYEVAGRGLARRGANFERALQDARRLRDALFAGGAADRAVKVKVKVKLIKRTGVKNVRFVLGQQSFKEGDLPPGQRMDMTWDMQPGAKVSVLGADQTEWAHIDFGNSPWGLLRLIRAGRYDVENSKDRSYRFTWTFRLGAEERQADVELEVQQTEAGPILTGTLFEDAHAPPERVEQ